MKKLFWLVLFFPVMARADSKLTALPVSTQTSLTDALYVVPTSVATSHQMSVDQLLKAGSTYFITAPGGSNTNVQFNNSGAFGGDNGFQYDSTADTVTIKNTLGVGILQIQPSSTTAGGIQVASNTVFNQNPVGRSLLSHVPWNNVYHLWDFWNGPPGSESINGGIGWMNGAAAPGLNVYNSAGTQKHFFSTDGSYTMAGSTLSINGVPYYWPNTQGGAGTVPQNDGSGNISWQTVSGGSSPGGSPTQLQYNNGASLGGAYFSSVTSTGLVLFSTISTSTPLIIQSTASQSVDLTIWRTLGGSNLAEVNSSGRWIGTNNVVAFNATGSMATIGFTGPGGEGGIAFGQSSDANMYRSGTRTVQLDANFNITSQNSSDVPLVIKDANGQTANLTEWKNSSGIQQATMTATGQVLVASATVADLTANSVVYADGTKHLASATLSGLTLVGGVLTATGGGGSSTLAVGTGTAANFTTQVTSPTAAISLLGAQFNSLANGTSNFVSLNQSSVTLLGQTIALNTNTSGIYVASVTVSNAFTLTGTNNMAAAAPIFSANSSSVTLRGQTISNGASGAIQYSDGSGGFNSDATHLYYDGTEMGVGTNSPIGNLTAKANGSVGTVMAVEGNGTRNSMEWDTSGGVVQSSIASNGEAYFPRVYATTVTAVSLSGDGTAITGIPQLKSTQTWSGGNTWTSSTTFTSTVSATGVSAVLIGQSVLVSTANLFQVGVSTTIQWTNAGHFEAHATTTPTVSSCGTGASVAANSSDTTGTLTMGAVTVGCTLTFSNPWVNVPQCFGNDETGVNAVRVVPTKTNVVFTTAGAGGDTVDWFCIGEQ